MALLAGVFAALLTALYIPLARRWQQLDEPGARSAHQRPTLSSGGLAIIAGLLLALLFGHLGALLPLAPREQLALLAVPALCVLGAVDDRTSLPVSLRLLLFLGVCAVLAWLYLPPRLALLLPLLVVALAWLINLFNFMDGIDGIAALQCALAAATCALLAFLQGSSAAFVGAALAVAAAYGAFLLFNWPPARLFMGDAGSLPGGYLLGWLGLWGWRDAGVSPLLWLLVMSPFLLDTGITLLLRFARGERVTQAHSTHFYQRLARHWQSHARVDRALLLLQCAWLLPLSLLAALGLLPPFAALVLGVLPQLVLIAKGAALQ